MVTPGSASLRDGPCVLCSILRWLGHVTEPEHPVRSGADHTSWTPGLESRGQGQLCGTLWILIFHTTPSNTWEPPAAASKASTPEKAIGVQLCAPRGVCGALWAGETRSAIPDAGQTFLQHGRSPPRCSLQKRAPDGPSEPEKRRGNGPRRPLLRSPVGNPHSLTTEENENEASSYVLCHVNSPIFWMCYYNC